MRHEIENVIASKEAAKLNIKSTEGEKLRAINPDIVDQIFEELDDYAEEMINQWKEDVVWSDYDETINYLKLKHAVKREAVLNKLVPDRVCPECGRIEKDDSHWRVDKWHASAICWTCLKTKYNYRTINSQFYPGYDEGEIVYLMRKVFHEPEVRYKINGKNLQKMRAMLGITQKSLADAIGVTAMITHLYEEGETKTITRDRAVKCLQLFKEYFKNRLVQLGYDIEKKDWHKPVIEEID